MLNMALFAFATSLKDPKGSRRLRQALGYALILLLIVAVTTLAEQSQDRCFCQVEDATGNIRKGCFTITQGYHRKTICRDATGEEFDVTDQGSGWTRLTAGEGLCSPCDIKLKLNPDGSIRGDEKAPPSETKHNVSKP
jgi:hypothetical protein